MCRYRFSQSSAQPGRQSARADSRTGALRIDQAVSDKGREAARIAGPFGDSGGGALLHDRTASSRARSRKSPETVEIQGVLPFDR